MYPRRVKVQKIISGRYAPGTKPLLWDDRVGGLEALLSDQGEELILLSGAGQSTPAQGWELLLTGEKSNNPGSDRGSGKTGITWTLYGIAAIK